MANVSSFTSDIYDFLLKKFLHKTPIAKSDYSKEQQTAVRKYYRGKLGARLVSDVIFGEGTERLLYEERVIPRTEEIGRVIDFFVNDSCGEGSNQIFKRTAKDYTGISRKQVLIRINGNPDYQKRGPAFKNVGPLQPIEAQTPMERLQTDLVNLTRVAFHCEKDNVTYRYVLVCIDVMSRFLWLRPLAKKSAEYVSTHLYGIFNEYEPPKISQADNGAEFQGAVKILCSKMSISMVHSAVRHPQTIGKGRTSFCRHLKFYKVMV